MQRASKEIDELLEQNKSEISHINFSLMKNFNPLKSMTINELINR